MPFDWSRDDVIFCDTFRKLPKNRLWAENDLINELSKSVVNVGENQVDADAVGTSAVVDLTTCKQLRTPLSIMTGL